MSSYRTELHNLRYNAATQCFEAIVAMYEGGEVIKYPIQAKLAIDTDFALVSRKLVEMAKKTRLERAGRLVSRTPRGQHQLANLANLAREFASSIQTGQRAA